MASSNFLLPLLISLAVLHLLAGRTAGDPTDGFVQQPLSTANFLFDKPYDKALSERYSFINGVHRFWVYDDDKPFRQDSPTKPRTEIRITGYDYTSGVWQFEGECYVPSGPSPGTTGVSIMQVFGATSRATTAMIRVYVSQLRYYNTNVLENNIYNRWFRLNVIHDANQGRVRVYINGALKLDTTDSGRANHYFKFGVYTQDFSSHYMESRWRNIKVLKQ
ncbi:Citrate-binding protein [Acorus gramineus]|uniref:Citrate-binding protein n=1 Tax=Acorus gramineus TaxID=55184 RepID=A0AAV9AFA9_ACOGR|nr:Citrate-binding protein [Acorus gramineus]